MTTDPPAPSLNESLLSQLLPDFTDIPSPAFASLGDYLQYICGSVKSQSHHILQLVDVGRRQNKLIHQLEDKVEIMSNLIQQGGISSTQKAEPPPAPNPPTLPPPSPQPPSSQPSVKPSRTPTSIYPVLPLVDPSPTIPRLSKFPSHTKLSCPDCWFSCTLLNTLDNHIAKKHSRPNHNNQSLTMMVGDSTMNTVNSRAVEAALGSGLLTGRSATRQGP